jgi:hypothetical protein
LPARSGVAHSAGGAIPKLLGDEDAGHLGGRRWRTDAPGRLIRLRVRLHTWRVEDDARNSSEHKSCRFFGRAGKHFWWRV